MSRQINQQETAVQIARERKARIFPKRNFKKAPFFRFHRRNPQSFEPLFLRHKFDIWIFLKGKLTLLFLADKKSTTGCIKGRTSEQS